MLPTLHVLMFFILFFFFARFRLSDVELKILVSITLRHMEKTRVPMTACVGVFDMFRLGKMDRI